MPGFKRYIYTIFCLILLQGSDFAQTPAETPQNPQADTSKTIHFGDLIDVDVVGFD
jgi:hypothetical protein